MKSYFIGTGITGILFSGISLLPMAAPSAWGLTAEEKLADFLKNPKKYVSEKSPIYKPVVKSYDPETGEALEITDLVPLTQSESKFSEEQIRQAETPGAKYEGSFVELKNRYYEGLGKTRQQLLQDGQIIKITSPDNPNEILGYSLTRENPGRAKIDYATDNPASVLGTDFETSLVKLDRYQEGKTTEQPWSGNYWPFYEGQLARRYADPGFPKSRKWEENANYIWPGFSTLAPNFAGLAPLAACEINQLSPAEKYDKLVGDPYKTLTRYSLLQGKWYFDRYGSVDTWMGICNGWALSSIKDRRPNRSVTVRAWDGDKITFYSADIKALSTLLWATTSPPTNYVGLRCDRKNPAKDPANDRIIDQDCFDTNPGSWHQVLVNRTGIQKKSFIMDATWNAEVWNQPIRSYKVKYFNPLNPFEPVTKLDKAKVSFKEFKNSGKDVFSKYRNNPAVAWVVGVDLELTYVRETVPDTEEDNPDRDVLRTVFYKYDLELDDKMRIVGGEWYRNDHPDFLWDVLQDEMWSSGDRFATTKWRAHHDQPVPEDWRIAAIRSSRYGQPLRKIVKKLAEKQFRLFSFN